MRILQAIDSERRKIALAAKGYLPCKYPRGSAPWTSLIFLTERKIALRGVRSAGRDPASLVVGRQRGRAGRRTSVKLKRWPKGQSYRARQVPRRRCPAQAGLFTNLDLLAKGVSGIFRIPRFRRKLRRNPKVEGVRASLTAIRN